MAGYRRIMDEPDSAAAQGDVYYADASGDTARLAAGTAGKVLTTNGAGANPTWETPSAPAGVVLTTTDQSIAGAKTFTGEIKVPTSAPGTPGNGHIWHGSGDDYFGFESGTTRRFVTHPDSAYSRGEIMIIGATIKPEMLAPGTSGYVLTSAGVGADPSWATPTMDITGLTADDFAFDDYIPFYDTSGPHNNKGFVSRLAGMVSPVCGLTLSLVTGNPAFNPVRSQTPSSTDTGTDIVTFATAHGLPSGTKVTVNATAGGLTAGTVYYINAASSTTLSFHTTVADAISGASKVNLTASITAAMLVMGVSGKTLYACLDKHNLIRLYDGTRWNLRTSAEISLDISAYTASKPYDIWIYDNAGTPAFDSTVWTDGTTRATALARQDGVYVKSGDATRLYVGTIYITSTTGVCEDSWGGLYSIGGRRFVWNYYNQRHRDIAVIESTTSWTDASAGYESLNTSTSNRFEVVVGLGHGSMSVKGIGSISMSASEAGWIGIGLDSTSTESAQLFSETGCNAGFGGVGILTTHAQYTGTLQVGYHYVQALQNRRLGTVAWNSNPALGGMSGLLAEVVG